MKDMSRRAVRIVGLIVGLVVSLGAAAWAQEGVLLKESDVKVNPPPAWKPDANKDRKDDLPPVSTISIKFRTITQLNGKEEVKLKVAENQDAGYDGGEAVATNLVPYAKMKDESLYVVVLVEGTYRFMGNDQYFDQVKAVNPDRKSVV